MSPLDYFTNHSLDGIEEDYELYDLDEEYMDLLQRNHSEYIARRRTDGGHYQERTILLM